MLENKARLLSIFLVLSIFFFALISLSVSVSASCCIIHSQRCDSSIMQQQCIGAGGQYYDTDCNQIPSCNLGCCCNPPDSYSGQNSNIYRFICPNNNIWEFFYINDYPEAIDSCLNFCQRRIQTRYTVSGHVYNGTFGHALEGATIGISGGPSVVTSTSGEYTLTGFVNRIIPYTIITTRESCLQNTSYVLINNENIVLDIILNCSSPCNSVYGDCTISQCNNYGGGTGYQIRTCIDLTCNGPPSIDVINCVISDDSFCRSINDHDQGEECYLNGTDFWPGPPQNTCPRDLCIPKGELGQCHCRSNPYCGDNTCQILPDYNECNPYCAIDCAGTRICPNTCEQSVPVLKNISHLNRTRALRLNWEFNGGNCLDHFIINKKYNGRLTQIPVYYNNYIDTNDILSNTEYCYNITAVFNNGRESNESNTKCLTTGDDYCYNSNQTSFCIDHNTIGRCDESNRRVSLPCGTDTICIMNVADPPEAQCAYQGPCDKCNGIYGMFAYLNFFVDYYYAGSDDIYDSVNCKDMGDSDMSVYNICYLEKTFTNTNKYEYCTNVTTCYDYKSKESCLNDPCNKFTTNPAVCEWAPLGQTIGQDTELGIGICRPVNEALQNCSKCNELFGGCNTELCKLYGNCYYNRDGSGVLPGQSCVHKKIMGCKEFDTEADCINHVPSIGRKESLIDVSWNNRKKVSGTNQFITRSNDYFGFGTCKWDSVLKCIKDADQNFLNDCAYNTDPIKCIHDNTPPNTTIILRNATDGYIYPIYGAGENFNVEYFVSDDYYSGNTTTYFCLNYVSSVNPLREGNTRNILTTPPSIRPSCDYPNIQGMSNLQTITTSMPSAVYDLLYFSEDLSKNIEPVKSVRLYIDTSPPLIYCNYIIESFETAQSTDVWVSNLSIVCTTNDKAICQGRLSKIIQIPENPLVYIPGGFHGMSEIFNANYYYMSDAHYTWNVECVDDYGNLGTWQEEIILNADKSISNPQPRGTLRTDSVVISVNTSSIAECRYNRITENSSPIYSAGTPFSTTGGLYHWSTTETTESGVYGYYTSCNFTNYRKIKQGDLGDSILFGIDKLPPITTLMNVVTGLPFDPNYVYNNTQLKLGFICNDTKPTLMYYGIIDFNFGCNETRYCIVGDDPDSNPNCAIDENYNVYNPLNPIELQFPNNNYEKILYYFSYDRGGNKEERHQVRIRLSNTFGPHILIDVT